MYNCCACSLPDNSLPPTKADVDLSIESKLETLAATQKISNVVVQVVVVEVVRELETIWGQLVPSIQLQDYHNLVRKVKNMRTDGQAELNFFGNYSGKGKKERKGFSQFKFNSNRLFDISSASQRWSRIDKLFYNDQVSKVHEKRSLFPLYI